MRIRCWSLILYAALLAAGCAASGLEKTRQEGGHPLSGKEIRSLVAGRVLHLDVYGMLAQAELSPDGSLTAANSLGETTGGKWSVEKEGRLCLKFNRWRRGEPFCSSVYQVGEEYRQLAANGALVGKFTVSSPELPASLRSHPTASPGADLPAASHSVPDVASLPQVVADDPRALADLRFMYREMAKDCPGCKLRRVDLAGANLLYANLPGADLREANFRGANFRRANLRGANLAGADLTDANLAGADLRGANLFGARLEGASLQHTNLEGANLKDVAGADFTDAIR